MSFFVSGRDLAQFARQLDRIEAALAKLTGQSGGTLINTTALVASVAQIRTVDGSIVALLNQIALNQANLAQQLKDAIAASDPAALAAVQQSIDDSVTEINSQNSAIVAAVLANTPQAAPAAA